MRPDIREEMKVAVENKDYEKIFHLLFSKEYVSEGPWTRDKVKIAFIQGWKECEKFKENVCTKN